MRSKDLDKQKRIKDAMVKLILREGIDGASVSKIAREAGVSPATIYVYYENKEDMLAEVFREYAGKSFEYLMKRMEPGMGGGELIDAIVQGYYSFSREHEEVFSFVEQCSRCPGLSEHVSEQKCSCDVLGLIHAYQSRGEMRKIHDLNMTALLFSPVRFLAMNGPFERGEEEVMLEEMAELLKGLLLI